MPVWMVRDPLFGDGGKAKVVDFLGEDERVAAVVRWQGGDNAGHTMVVKGEKIAVHAIPSGVVRGHRSVMGRGMVINLPRVFAEIDRLRKRSIQITPDILMISEGAKLTLPYHMALEKARETSADRMGTTAKAISQTYGMHRFYQGVLAGDVSDLDYVRERIRMPLSCANAILENVFRKPTVKEDEVMAEVETYRDVLLPYLGNEIPLLNELLDQDKVVLAEGAQSGMLDVDLGIYPNTTASNTWPGSLQAGCGIDPRRISRDIAVVKAYITRVGQGHLVGEMPREIGNRVRERGQEFGTTTGRPRRIGYADDPIGYYCTMIAPPTELAITKVDVLTGIRPLQICTSYTIDGRPVPIFPTTVTELNACQGVFEEMPGWSEDVTGVTNWDDLPGNTQRYLERVAKPYGCPLTMVGTGPGREQLIVRQ